MEDTKMFAYVINRVIKSLMKYDEEEKALILYYITSDIMNTQSRAYRMRRIISR